MTVATLLLRERSISLTATVTKAQQQRPLHHRQYRLDLSTNRLDFTPLTSATPLTAAPNYTKQPSQDEGFESDIDSLSLVSSDDSSITITTPSPATVTTSSITKSPETDSANGSACSDDSSDDSSSGEHSPPVLLDEQLTEDGGVKYTTESYNLVNVCCYTDVTCPELLVCAVTNGDTLVFRFAGAEQLNRFYSTLSALKAVTNQRAYSSKTLKGTSGGGTFNLLQRTDTNGITHTEISRENNSYFPKLNSGSTSYEPTSIISIDTPEHIEGSSLKYFYQRSPGVRNVDSRQRIQSSFSSENLLEADLDAYQSLGGSNASNSSTLRSDKTLRKVWSSAENLLDSSLAPPIKPDRKKKLKNRAPPPPVSVSTNSTPANKEPVNITKLNSILRTGNNMDTIPRTTMRHQFQNFFSSKPTQTTTASIKPLKPQSFQPFKYSDPKHVVVDPVQPSQPRYFGPWSSSTVPRRHSTQVRPPVVPSTIRSKSETRTNFLGHIPLQIPVRFVQNPKKATNVGNSYQNTGTISNRLFGMSGKLKEFSSVQCGGSPNGSSTRVSAAGTGSTRWSSLGELSYRSGVTGQYQDSNLKSVIKKEPDSKRKNNEKKVTFSAFTTVKVL